MQHELFVDLAAERIDLLLVRRRAERCDHQRLRFTAREERRAVRPRQDTDFRRDLTDIGETSAVDALALLDDQAAHGVVLRVPEEALDVLLAVGELAREARQQIAANLANRIAALVLPDRLHGRANLRQHRIPHALLQRRVDHRRHDGALRFAERLLQLVLEVEDLLHLAVSGEERVEDHVLRQHLGAAFHHDDRVPRSGDDQLKLALGVLRHRRVDDELPTDAAHANARDRAAERNVRNLQRSGRPDQCRHVGVVLFVERQNGCDDLGFAAETLRKERPQRPVDQAGVENFLLTLPPLALEEPAGNLTRGERLLLVIASQRKEIDVLARFFRGGSGDEHHRVSVLHQRGATGLPRHAPDLDGERSPMEIDFNFFHLSHSRPHMGICLENVNCKARN